MKRNELIELARLGMTARLKAIEAELADAFKQFPDVFATRTPPVLVRPELRNGHAKHWPATGPAMKVKAFKSQSSAAITQNREQSARLLQFVADAGKPVSPEQIATGANVSRRTYVPLVRTGYLKKTKRGYVRTGKVFIVSKYEADSASKRSKA